MENIIKMILMHKADLKGDFETPPKKLVSEKGAVEIKHFPNSNDDYIVKVRKKKTKTVFFYYYLHRDYSGLWEIWRYDKKTNIVMGEYPLQYIRVAE